MSWNAFLGGWAYVVGALLSIVVFTGLYTLYHIWIRATACEPIGSLACGEPFITAFFLFLGIGFVLLFANVLAQTSLYLFLYGRRQPLPSALYEEAGEETGAEMAAPAAAPGEQFEPLAEMPTEQQYAPEADFSGLPPDAPEEEPPRSTA